MEPAVFVVAAVAILSVTVTVAAIVRWAGKPPVRYGPTPVVHVRPAEPSVPGAFSLSDPVHLLAVLVLAGGLLLVLFGLL